MAILHLTHDDLDGVACGLLGIVHGFDYTGFCGYNEKSKYWIGTVLNEFKRAHEDLDFSSIVITDFNVNESVYSELKSIYPTTPFVILDHHQDTIKNEKLNTNDILVHTEERAGCKIMYDYYNNPEFEKYEYFVNMSDLYDRWELTDECANLQRVFYYLVFMNPAYKYDKFPKKLRRFIQMVVADTPTSDYKPDWYNRTLKKYFAVVEPQLETLFNTNDVVNNVRIFRFEKNHSLPTFEIGIRAGKMPDMKNFMYIFEDNDNFLVSLRTCDDSVLLSEIAKEFGGGGHPSAAGFSTQTKNADELMNVVMQCSSLMDRAHEYEKYLVS